MLKPATDLTCLATGLLLIAGAQAAELPTEGLVLHLDATQLPGADPRLLAEWPDLSGQDHTVKQGDAAWQPTRVANGLNGQPVVRFNGHAYLDGPAVLPEGCSTLTIVAVWRRVDNHGVGAICEQADSGIGRRASLLTVNDRYGFNGQNNDQHGLLTYRPKAATLSVLTLDANGLVRLWHNDDRDGTGRCGQLDGKLQNTGAKRFRIGGKAAYQGEFLRGDLAEILVYNRVLTVPDITTVNETLAAKWGLGQLLDGQRRVVTMSTEKMDEGPDYTSKVPQDTFGTTLAEQEAQLKDNLLLARFRESRAKLAADPYRPAYHFVSPEHSLNDPNGLCFWQGRWHLFYQGYPPEDPRQHWGHAVSDDLIHWRDLPYAIYPHPERCCFSGATLVEPDRVIAMYHGTEVGNLVAASSDPLLLNWEKLTGKAVIPMRSPDGSALPYRVFDPCIWQQGDFYYSLSAGVQQDSADKPIRADFLLRSKDLVTWEYLHPFAEADQYSLVGDDGACPYFWPIGDRHILLHYSHMSGGKYLLGRYDTERQKLLVTGGGDFNFGASGPGGVHAPSAAPDGHGGVIAIFNMNPAKPTRGWNQIMSLPRRLTLNDEGELLQSPAGNYQSLRGEHQTVGETPLPANEEVVLPGISGNTLELQAEIVPQGASVVELNVLRSANREESTRIAIYPNRGYHYRFRGGQPGNDTVVLLDNTCSSTLPDVMARPPERAQVFLPPDEPLKLHVFIDRSIVEVFVNGKQCLGLRVYPGREDSLGVSLVSRGKPAVLKSLEAWQMARADGLSR